MLLVWWPNSEAQKQLTNHTNNHTQRGALKLTSVNAGKLKNCQTPVLAQTKAKRLGVDFVLPPSQEQGQEQQPHQNSNEGKVQEC